MERSETSDSGARPLVSQPGLLIAPQVPPAVQSGWNPPAWLVHTLIESGDGDLLDAPPEPRRSRAASSSGPEPAPTSTANTSVSPRPRQGTDVISLTQATDEYCKGSSPESETLEDPAQGDASESDEGVVPPDDQVETHPSPEQPISHAYEPGIYMGVCPTMPKEWAKLF